MGQPAPAPKPTHRSALPLALVAAVTAAVWAGWNAWAEQQVRTTPLDLDGWGWLIVQMQTNGRNLATLFTSPSLWKGPVVPFVFGLCYYIAPTAESVLVLNAAFFALSAAVLVCAFHALGANRWAATAAVLAWVLYLPHTVVFGYYYAEPFLGLLSALLLLLAAWTLKTRPRLGALACGAVAGLLLLARAPFLPVVAGLGVFLWLRLGKRAGRRPGYIYSDCWSYTLPGLSATGQWRENSSLSQRREERFFSRGRIWPATIR